MNHPNQKLINALNACAAACNQCATACLDENDLGMLVRCIRTDLDCAAICTVVAGYAARESDYTGSLAAECAGICMDCAEECDKHAHMDHCRYCAEACRTCADACKAA